MSATESAGAAPRRWPKTAVVSAILCILLVIPLGVLAQMSLDDDYAVSSRTDERLWAGAARVLCLLPIAASVGALFSIGGTSPRLRSAVSVLLTASIVALGLLCVMGVRWYIEAEEMGGDWAGLGMAVALVFGVLHPGAVLLLCLLQRLALRDAIP